MGSNIRSWLVWFIPFLVSGGMAFGALIGITGFSDAARQDGPAGDIAGAAGALIIVICIGVGFVMAMLTIIVAKVLRRSAFDHLALRVGVSIVSGVVIGALESNAGDMTTAVVWVLLIGFPVLIAWPWKGKADSGTKTPMK